MNEEHYIQQTERASHVPAPLVEYIDQKIEELNRDISNLGIKGGGARKLVDIDEVQEEITQLQKTRDAMYYGQYSGVESLLQMEQAQAEQALTHLQQQMRPLSQNPEEETMRGDQIFRMYKVRILREQGILAKAAAVLDQEDKSYIAIKIEEYRSGQRKTERGSVLDGMGYWQGQIKSIQGLRQLLPQPGIKR